MTLAGLKIRPLQSKELPLLHYFAPPDWNTDIALLFRNHFGQPYFYPIAGELAGRIVGCANGLLNGTSGWLGNIVVLPEYRGQGIGSALTEHLVEYFHARGCTSQVLTATQMGEPIYTKLGFTTRSTYAFLRKGTDSTEPVAHPSLLSGTERSGSSVQPTRRPLAGKVIHPRPIHQIRQAGPKDFEAIRALDEEITGEKRAAFLERHLAEGWVYQASPQQAVAGFFLPGLGEGPIIAREEQAGLALLQFKLRYWPAFTLPAANQAAIDCMAENGFHVHHTLPRMVLGPELNWRPDGIFSRAAGYCG